MAGSENGAGATGAGTGAGAGPAGGTVAGYTRFPVVKPVPHLPTMQGLQSGLNYDFPPDFGALSGATAACFARPFICVYPWLLVLRAGS